MAENSAPDVRLDANSNGTVYFATDVVATIAGLAVTEVEGVANTVSGYNGLADIFARRVQGNARNLTRGVKVEVVNNVVSVDVTIIVEYGSPVPEVAGNIQENVKKAIETMTGMSVERVDVHVSGVSFERENRAVAELEMQQRKLLEKKPEAFSETQAQEAPIEAVNEDQAEEEDQAEATIEPPIETPVDISTEGEIGTADDISSENNAYEDEYDDEDDDFELILEEPEPEYDADAPLSDEDADETATQNDDADEQVDAQTV